MRNETSVVSALRKNAATFAGMSRFDPEREFERCEKAAIEILLPEDPQYPQLLAQIAEPPLLYVRGKVSSENSLAVVGSRKPTVYGLRAARSLASEMAGRSIVSVSGLARGIDTAVHRASLDAGGQTWAVLGAGLERIYPFENQRLAEEIVAAGGALISEAPLEAAPTPENFPRRNRIISGLSWGTIVVEGHDKSGSLITARNALEQGRDVFAVPGPIDSLMSEGPNRLIKTGAAALVTGWEDIFEQLPPVFRRKRCLVQEKAADASSPGVATPEEKRLLELMGSGQVHLEVLIKETSLDVDNLAAILIEMELKGLVQSHPGQQYSLP